MKILKAVLFKKKIENHTLEIFYDYYLNEKYVYIKKEDEIRNRKGEVYSGVQLLDNFCRETYIKINSHDNPEYFLR